MNDMNVRNSMAFALELHGKSAANSSKGQLLTRVVLRCSLPDCWFTGKLTGNFLLPEQHGTKISEHWELEETQDMLQTVIQASTLTVTVLGQ